MRRKGSRWTARARNAMRLANSLHKPKKIEISIPKGVDTGMRLRVPGSRGTVPKRGPPGNLFVVIHVLHHPIFKRDGPNLRIEKDITFAEAALGGEVKVPTLFGSAMLSIRKEHRQARNSG